MLPIELQKLVSTFKDNYDCYKNAGYNETQLRREFLDKLIKILGWDIDNEKGNAETFKEVIHEDRIKISGQSKAPDYSVQFGGRRLFFIEAKKPFVFIKGEFDPAFQIRRYGWNAKLPLCILTDFEEFAIYDTTIKPNANDKPSTARIFYCKFNEYEDPCKQYPEFETNWDFITSLFSQNSVLKGSLEKFERKGKKKGTDEVDDEFLKDIESWRELLAKNLALRNELTGRDLNFAVQTTIDRIIFLRICEDRGIEEYGLLEKISKDKDIYKALVRLFEEADAKYNSGLFHFANEKGRSGNVDTLTPRLLIDDKPLKDIIKGLYYPCPYEFSVMPADILGSVYERFLGKVIRLSSEHRATIEEKPEVRKAGGVYYTPSYIVDYIVKNTVGELVKDKTPKQAEGIRVLDPACGSGSFLIVAYQYLLDWYLNEYLKDKEKYKKFIYQTDKNNWRLTTSERKRILISHIYGVDIDSQAVEVTKLSLLLKVLEGESKENIQSQMKLFKERALPDLGNNIKCGNSLIGSDFYNQQNLQLTEEDQYKINVFDWEKEFPEVFKSGGQSHGEARRSEDGQSHAIAEGDDGQSHDEARRSDGGFDAVIGNPPYFSVSTLSKEEKEYFQIHYKTFSGTTDIYAIFYEKGYDVLAEKGFMAFITSNKWMRTKYGENLRRFFIENTTIKNIVDFGGKKIFKDAAVDTNIIVYQKQRPQTNHIVKIKNSYLEGGVAQSVLTSSSFILESPQILQLKEKIEKIGTPLKDWDVQICRGILTGLNEAFIIDTKTKEKLCGKDPKSAEIIKPVLRGRDIKRYSYKWADLWLINSHNGYKNNPKINIQNDYPAIYEYLLQHKDKASIRYDKGEHWTNLRNCAYVDDFEKEKIIWKEMGVDPTFYLDKEKYYTNDTTTFMVGDNLAYLVGVLNSKLGHFLFKKFYAGGGLGNTGIRYKKDFLQELPIPNLDLSKKEDRVRHDRMVELVEKMLELKKKEQSVKNPSEKTMISRQIEATDNQIDTLVYTLYALTDEEIKIVEGK